MAFALENALTGIYQLFSYNDFLLFLVIYLFFWFASKYDKIAVNEYFVFIFSSFYRVNEQEIIFKRFHV